MYSSFAAENLIYAEPLLSTSFLTAGLSTYPTTPGQHVLVLHAENLFRLPLIEFQKIMRVVRQYANFIKTHSRVQRCGLAYDGFRNIHVIPMHGLSESWSPILARETPMINEYPGFLWTKSSPQLSGEELVATQSKIIAYSGWQRPDNTFSGDPTNSNLFAKLVRGEIPQWRIWEDRSHVAFLTPFPNTPGYSVFIPRKHLSSDILSLSSQDFDDLVQAAHAVADVLMSGMSTTRVGLFFEGFEIDYAHAKLVPVLDDTAGIQGSSDEYHETYPGHITTKLGPKRGPDDLDQLHKGLQSFLASNPIAIDTL